MKGDPTRSGLIRLYHVIKPAHLITPKKRKNLIISIFFAVSQGQGHLVQNLGEIISKVSFLGLKNAQKI